MTFPSNLHVEHTVSVSRGACAGCVHGVYIGKLPTRVYREGIYTHQDTHRGVQGGHIYPPGCLPRVYKRDIPTRVPPMGVQRGIYPPG